MDNNLDKVKKGSIKSSGVQRNEPKTSQNKKSATDTTTTRSSVQSANERESTPSTQITTVHKQGTTNKKVTVRRETAVSRKKTTTTRKDGILSQAKSRRETCNALPNNLADSKIGQRNTSLVRKTTGIHLSKDSKESKGHGETVDNSETRQVANHSKVGPTGKTCTKNKAKVERRDTTHSQRTSAYGESSPCEQTKKNTTSQRNQSTRRQSSTKNESKKKKYVACIPSIQEEKRAEIDPNEGRSLQPRKPYHVLEKRREDKGELSTLMITGRRNGCSQNAMFLKSAPCSPNLSPVSSPEERSKSASPYERRRPAFFADNIKAKTAEEKRRDAVCQSTNTFAGELVAVRVLWKKF